MNRDLEYDYLSDLFEYGIIDEMEAITICNTIIFNSINEKDSKVLEAMFHAIFTCVNTINIAEKLRLDIIEDNIEKYPEFVLDYVVTIMAYTGKKKYIKIINDIGKNYSNIDIEEALVELKARIK